MNSPHSDRFARDGDLVRRAQSGEGEAVAEIYLEHVQSIYRYILYRVGESATADDLTSEVFLRAIEALPRYRHRGAPFAAWLFRIARDRVSDYFRHHNRRPILELDESQFDESPGPEASLDQQDEERKVRAQLLQLTPEQRDVIYFRFTEGLSLQETALLMGRRVGAIKALQFRALRRLARRLE